MYPERCPDHPSTTLRVTPWLPVFAAEMTGWAAPGVGLTTYSLAASGFELIGWATGDTGPGLLPVLR